MAIGQQDLLPARFHQAADVLCEECCTSWSAFVFQRVACGANGRAQLPAQKWHILCPPPTTVDFFTPSLFPDTPKLQLMLCRGIARVSRAPCRRYSTLRHPRPIPVLSDASLETFRREAFEPGKPALFPRKHFETIPAVQRWFENAKQGRVALNVAYLSKFGATIVPLEITNNGQFVRVEHSLSFFLECVKASTSRYRKKHNRYFSAYVPHARAIVKRETESNDFFTSTSTVTTPTARVYLAQASLADFPKALRDDVPTPEVVLQAGKGDIYDSSLWIGQAPTYTPLHRDPNPNVFVQLAGKKKIRCFAPRVGHAIFAKVQEQIGGSAVATMRGEEMMQGEEKQALENEVWQSAGSHMEHCFEAEVDSGDGLYIPKGYWHSVKGEGNGIVGSVS